MKRKVILVIVAFLALQCYLIVDKNLSINRTKQIEDKIWNEGETTVATCTGAFKHYKYGCRLFFTFEVNGSFYETEKGVSNSYCERDSSYLVVGKKFYVKYLKEDPNISRALINPPVEQ